VNSASPAEVAAPKPAPVPAARPVPRSWNVAKRAIDIAVAVLALALTWPLIVISTLAIVVVSPGSPFFLQERVGKNGRRFRMFKLRTMVDGAHRYHEEMRALSDVRGPVLKIRDDPRVHPIGKFLRRTSIDELPNLINVVRGEMSIVGPRPPLPQEVAHYDRFAMRRLTVKPGITCLWQISGRSNVSFDEWMRLDNLYIDSWSPLGDIAIIARTIPAVLGGEGAH
jgi:lipopolysaccharide/colanic/teichoic acid biosynthesis glycosyltransferase